MHSSVDLIAWAAAGRMCFAPCEAVSGTILHAAAHLPTTTLAWLCTDSTIVRHP